MMRTPPAGGARAVVSGLLPGTLVHDMVSTEQGASLPRTGGLDATLALMEDPYGWIGARCDELGSEAFSTRVMLRRTVCLRGSEAAALFYDAERFERDGAMPGIVKNVLLGKAGVQGLDGAAHRHRKAMLMSFMTPAAVTRIGEIARRELEAASARWLEASGREPANGLALYPELRALVTRTACEWAGVPLPPDRVERTARMLAAMYEHVADLGLGHLKARRARREANAWAGRIVSDARTGALGTVPGTALHAIAEHRDPRGHPLDVSVAAVELLNVLRPTVAVALFMTHAAHALYEHPGARERVRHDPDGTARAFAQEVRRLYPFFPLAAARTRKAFAWHGHRFPAGVRVLLDIPGTNRDPAAWDDPDRFDPSRFIGTEPGAFELVAQGGGDHYTGHRCAGEWITIELMRAAVHHFACVLDYDVPPDDLDIDTGEVPAMPGNALRLVNLRPRERGAAAKGPRAVARPSDIASA